jgi:hypothetical protein
MSRQIILSVEFVPVHRVLEQNDQVGAEPGGIVVRTSVEPSSVVSAIRQAGLARG